jgi:branched-chain amino acid transport system substrate-binding protein
LYMNTRRTTRSIAFLVTLIVILSTFSMQGSIARTSYAATEAATTAADQPTPTAMALSGDPILIGISVAQTSDVALLGQEEVVGAQIAEAFFNQRGGVNGRPIKLVFQDTAGAPETAVNAFKALISGNVVAIVGPTLSTQARAADPVADQAGVPVLAPSNTAAGIPQLGAFVTRVSAPVAVYAPLAIDVAKDLNANIKNVVVMYAQDDVFSTSETKTFQDGATSRGLTVAGVFTFSVKDRQFDSVIGPALDAKPDLIIISGLAADGGNLVKQLRESEYKGLIIGGNGLNTANMFPVCQDKCDGLLVAQAYRGEYESPINSEFVTAYRLTTKRDIPPQFTGQTFTCVQIAVEALRAVEKAGKLNTSDLAQLRKDLNAAIQSGKYDTPLGMISFTRAKDDKGVEKGAEVVQTLFHVAQIKMDADGKNGKFTRVKSIDTAAK